MQLLHITSEPVMLLRNDFAVILVMVYVYLPYMILPLYSTIEKLDFTLLDAAMDLGANTKQAFFKVTLPLSKSGIFAGSVLVFIPALGAYIIPQLVGSQSSLYIGQIITYKIKNIPRNWPLASALSLVLLLIITIMIVIGYYLHTKYKQKEFKINEEEI
jgi:ABC-type spermidine/putrescine transport system permease subunit I